MVGVVGVEALGILKTQTVQGVFPHSPFSLLFILKRTVPVEDLAACKFMQYELPLNDDWSNKSERVKNTVPRGQNTSTGERCWNHSIYQSLGQLLAHSQGLFKLHVNKELENENHSDNSNTLDFLTCSQVRFFLLDDLVVGEVASLLIRTPRHQDPISGEPQSNH